MNFNVVEGGNGIFHASKMVYIGEKIKKLPKCCILNVRFERCNHLIIYFNEKYYDSSVGILEEYDYNRIIGYLEIYTA